MDVEHLQQILPPGHRATWWKPMHVEAQGSATSKTTEGNVTELKNFEYKYDYYLNLPISH